MTVNEIVSFLNDKPGYYREGAGRLANKVLKGKASKEDCRVALKIVRQQEFNEIENYVDNTLIPNLETTTKLKLKSKWQNASGKWLESYVNTEDLENKTDILTKEDIENSFKSIVNIKPVIIDNEYNLSTKSMLVWTADKHIGADTKDTQHNNHYSKYEFASRMNELIRNIARKSNELGGFNTLVIADLGDAIDGQDGYTASRTHKLPQNLSNKEMFDTYLSVHIQFIDTLVNNNLANNYEFWFNTMSNHGGSYEYACHKAFQLYIETKYPQIKVKSFDNFIGHTEFNGVTYILTHGKDDKNRKFGLPLYPDPKTEVFIDNYLKMNKLSFNKNIRLIKGDLHQSCSAPCKNINKYRNVASMFGSSGWVMDNFGFTNAGTDYEVLENTTGEIMEGTFWYN